MQHHYLFLYLSIPSVLTSMAMQEQTYLTQMPNCIAYNILKYLSTEQILRFREINKQAQKVAALLLKTDYSKKITITYNTCPQISLIQKLSGITLQVSGHVNQPIKELVNNVAHIKALTLDFAGGVFLQEKQDITTILNQVQQLEVLKIAEFCAGRQDGNWLLAWFLQRLPAYAYLKKLHINSLTQDLTYWNTLLQILPNLKKLEVIHIEGSRPDTTAQYIAFMQVLQTLLTLKKLCIHAPRNKQEANALTKLRSTLKNLRVLNIFKNIRLQRIVPFFFLTNSMIRLNEHAIP